jgi:hypothetical protein
MAAYAGRRRRAAGCGGARAAVRARGAARGMQCRGETRPASVEAVLVLGAAALIGKALVIGHVTTSLSDGRAGSTGAAKELSCKRSRRVHTQTHDAGGR